MSGARQTRLERAFAMSKNEVNHLGEFSKTRPVANSVRLLHGLDEDTKKGGTLLIHSTEGCLDPSNGKAVHDKVSVPQAGGAHKNKGGIWRDSDHSIPKTKSE